MPTTTCSWRRACHPPSSMPSFGVTLNVESVGLMTTLAALTKISSVSRTE